MKNYICDDCNRELKSIDAVNTVTLKNDYSEPQEYHYCYLCAKKLFPKAKSLISWTAPNL